MAYTTSTPFGSTGQYNYIAPSDTLLYCFSPYYIEIETELSGQEVTITSGTFTAKRYSNANKKVKFYISELMQNYFKDIEFGQILDADSGVYTNSATKLMRREKSINVKVADDTYEDWLTLTYDIVWGAMQIGEIFEDETTIYAFRKDGVTLPLTITQLVGDDLGVDLWVSKKIDDDDAFNDIELISGSTVLKTYHIKELPYCHGGVYLRWITKGEYKYFYFSEGVTVDELKDGNNINNNVWSLESINNEIKGDIRLKNKTGKQTYQCGVLCATYEQQMHLIGLQRAVQVWMLENDNWVEVKVESEPIQIDRFRSNKEVNITVIKPSLFIESL